MQGRDGLQQTALHWAAVRGSVAAAQVLLDAHARTDALDQSGYTVRSSLPSTSPTRYRQREGCVLGRITLEWSDSR